MLFKKLKLLVITSLLLLVSACGNNVSSSSNIVENTIIEISFKGYGIVEAELYPDIAPITVNNFVKLINEGFYDGLTIHRVIKGFVIQGGDPNGDGTGGSKDTIIGEFLANGYNNPLLHEAGVLSMARSDRYNSASSQFFIVHEEASFLNNFYAAFGKVTKGLEIIDQIANIETGENDRPLEMITIEYIRIKK